MSELKKVLVCIPTYNEAENIEPITARIRQYNPAVDILVADDNSPDGTGQIADTLAAADPQVHVLHREAKAGLAAAYTAAFEWGMAHGYDVLVEHDADGSHRPEELPFLLDALEDADVVKGSRWMPGGKVVNWPFSREILSRAGNLWVRLWLGVRVKDATGGFVAWRADTLRAINLADVQAAGYGFQVDLIWKALQHGFRVVEVPITFCERSAGDSKMSSKIVIEAMALTARWGLKYRLGQLSRIRSKN